MRCPIPGREELACSPAFAVAIPRAIGAPAATEGDTMGKNGLAILLGLVLVGPAAAQGPGWRFRWQPGQVLPYRVEQVTTVTEVVGGNKVEMTAKVTVLKHWQVLEVDAQGVATL